MSKIIITLLTIIFFTPTVVSALTMTNSDYLLHMGNLNMAGGSVSGSGKKLGFTAGQTSPGLYSKDGVNFKVKAGFQYIHSIIPFAFAISSSVVDFGPLVPGEPVTRFNFLTISNGSGYGYEVLAFENHPLKTFNSEGTIPDTTCDNGSCTQTTSSAWTNPLTYGFGYRCDDVSGTNCSAGFSDATYYKQFANNEDSEMPVAVMSGANVGRDLQSRITYKVNVSGSQATGQYTNVITYVAVPSY